MYPFNHRLVSNVGYAIASSSHCFVAYVLQYSYRINNQERAVGEYSKLLVIQVRWPNEIK
jgi:hypothetical protein